MHTNKNRVARLALTGCVALSIGLTGCKSGKSPMNLFSFKKSEPSPEVLAGNGPTVTYPAPPSANSTPSAIASIPGGTAGSASPGGPITKPTAAQVAANTPGYVTSAPNMSAAQANGYRTPSLGTNGLNVQAASTRIATNPPKTTVPGYQFGSKPAVTTPKTSTKSSYTIPSLPTLPTKSPPATGMTAPTPPSSSSAGGFTLPSGLAGAVQATSQAISKSTDSAKKAASSAMEQTKSMDIPSIGISTPTTPSAGPSIGISEPSTPSIQLNPKAVPAFSTSPSPPATFATPPSEGVPAGIYTPGSTAGASGYPSK